MPLDELIIDDATGGTGSGTENTFEYEGTTYNTNEAGDLLNEDGTVFKTKTELESTDPPADKTIEIDGESYTLDDKGNAIKDGVIVKTKEELESIASGSGEDDEQVEIDGQLYTIKDGAAVDSDGNVFKTKEELEALAAESDDEPTGFDINKIAESTGLTFIDNDGNPVEYESSEVGLAAYVKDVHQNGMEKGINEGIKSLYDINPLIQSFVEHIKLNGSADGFNQNVAYSTMKIDEKNEDGMISVIRAARKAKGDSEAEISQYVSWAKSANQLKDSADNSLKYLQAQESVEAKNRAAALAQKQAADEAAFKEEVNAVANVLQQGKIKLSDNKEFVIPKTLDMPTADGKIVKIDSSNLVDYITTPRQYTVDGKTVTMTAYEAKKYIEERSQTTEQKLIHAIQLLTGTKMEDLLSRAVSSATVKKIRKFTTKKNKHSAGTSNPKSFNKNDIIFE